LAEARARPLRSHRRSRPRALSPPRGHCRTPRARTPIANCPYTQLRFESSAPAARAPAGPADTSARRGPGDARPRRRAVVEEPRQDAHVVVGELAEDEVRRDAAPGAEARAL